MDFGGNSFFGVFGDGIELGSGVVGVFMLLSRKKRPPTCGGRWKFLGFCFFCIREIERRKSFNIFWILDLQKSNNLIFNPVCM